MSAEQPEPPDASDNSIDLQNSRARVLHDVSSVSKGVKGATALCIAAIVVRITGQKSVPVVAGVSTHVDLLIFALPILTFAHYYLAYVLGNDLEDLRVAEAEASSTSASAVWADLPNQGWLVHHLTGRKVAPNGTILVDKRDPSAQAGTAFLFLAAVAVFPWKLSDGPKLSRDWWLVLLMAAFLMIILGVNWKIAASWMMRVSELALPPGDRVKTKDGWVSPEEDSGCLMPDSGWFIGYGVVMMVCGYVCLGGALVGYLLSR
jgi:hypothetical protein